MKPRRSADRKLSLHVVVLASVVTVAVVGCGGDRAPDLTNEERTYVEQVKRLDADLEVRADVAEQQSTTNLPSDRQDAVLRQLAVDETGTVERFALIMPPQHLRAEHDALVGAMREAASALTRMVASAQAKDMAGYQEAFTSHDRAVQRIERARAKLDSELSAD